MLLAVAALACGCARGDFGRPRQTIFESRILNADAGATEAERELDARLWRFRSAPAALPGHFSPARFNALRDEIESDRQLLGPLARSLQEAGATQDMRAAALSGLGHVDAESRMRAGERIDRGDAIAASFCPSLAQRISNYRATLESMVVLSPQIEAASAERALIALEAEAGAMCGGGSKPEVPDGSNGKPLSIRK